LFDYEEPNSFEKNKKKAVLEKIDELESENDRMKKKLERVATKPINWKLY
jgi:hypothetical protein